jgi:hypothetical protein
MNLRMLGLLLACVCVGMDDSILGVCGDTFEELVTRAFSGGEHNLTQSSDRSIGACVGHSLQSTCCGYTLFGGYLRSLMATTFEDYACFSK